VVNHPDLILSPPVASCTAYTKETPAKAAGVPHNLVKVGEEGKFSQGLIGFKQTFAAMLLI
jgi:hypothetical protein